MNRDKAQRLSARLQKDMRDFARLSCWDLPFEEQRVVLRVIRAVASDRLLGLEGAEERLHNEWRAPKETAV